MEIKVNREIRNYNEAIFLGLSMRQFVCSVLAVGIAVTLQPLHCLLRRQTDTSALSTAWSRANSGELRFVDSYFILLPPLIKK